MLAIAPTEIIYIMDSSEIWAFTIVSGVLIGVIVLFVEYNYFQGRSKSSILASNPTWAGAIKKAVKNLTDYATYQIADIEILSTTIDKGKAILDIYEIIGRLTSNPQRRRHFIVTIDRTGDILEIKRIDSQNEPK